MRKHHIIPIVILLVVIAGFAAVYQLYVKEQIEEFQENEARFERLDSRIKQFQEFFAGADGQPVKPEAAVSQWRNAVQPFREAVRSRASYFHLGDTMSGVNYVPEDVEPKFHYQEELPKRVYEMQQYAAQRGTILSQLFMFGVPSQKDLTGTRASKEDVDRWLTQYQFGFSIVKMLVDAGAARIDNIVIWPKRQEFDLLNMRTVGLQFQMTVDNLARFLRDFYGEDRYFNINAIRISNSNLLSPTKPLLNVEMVLTQAGFIEENAAQGLGSSPAAGGGGAQASPFAGGGGSAQDMLAILRKRGGLGGRDGERVGRVKPKPWWKKWLPF